jgi:hypothetical protein
LIQLKSPRAQDEPPHAGPLEILLEVNGAREPLTVGPQMTLADVLAARSTSWAPRSAATAAPAQRAGLGSTASRCSRA